MSDLLQPEVLVSAVVSAVTAAAVCGFLIIPAGLMGRHQRRPVSRRRDFDSEHADSLFDLPPRSEWPSAEYLRNQGFQYSHGVGVKRNCEIAARMFRMAAEQGDALAQTSLSLLYSEGVGVLRSPEAAFHWCNLAAQQGYDVAESRLGTMYGKGEGTRKDIVQAHYWLSRAAAQSHNTDTKATQKLRDHIAKQMTEAQLKVSNRMFAEWQAKYTQPFVPPEKQDNQKSRMQGLRLI